jgi:uncharacterized protein YggE
MFRLITFFLTVPLLLEPVVSQAQGQNVLIVSGRGEVETEPDLATIAMGVSTIDFSAELAYGENNEKMSRVIDDLKELGVDRTDIKTTDFSIQPAYEHDRTTGERRFKGYRVNHTIVVRVKDLEAIGKLLDQIVSAGVTDLSGISFGVQTPTKLESVARTRAIEDAYRKATELAQAAGVKLGPPIRIEETRYTPKPLARSFEMEHAPPIEPGMYRTALSVIVHYLIE